MRVLITGITGFAGSYLARHYLDEGAQVHGIRRPGSSLDRIADLGARIRFHELDLRQGEGVREIIEHARADNIFHLAASSNVAGSFENPVDTYLSNMTCQIHLLDAVRQSGLYPRIHIAGSSDEYGRVLPDEIPIKEDNALRPLSPYAVSKVTQDLMGYQYHRNYGLWIVRTRAFNHTGPRRAESYAASNFAKQIALIEQGASEPVVHVGNLDVVRDFTDVRDVARAYALCVERGLAGEVYNVSSGRGIRIGDILETLMSFTSGKIEVQVDHGRLRADDIPVLIGDSSRIEKRTGWRPRIPLKTTLEDLLAYWRERVRAVQGSMVS